MRKTDLAAKECWTRLKKNAIDNKKIAYGDLATIVDYPVRSIAKVLSLLQNHCIENELPPITSLVVNKSTNEPGAGYIIRYGAIEIDQKVNSSFNWMDLDSSLEYSYNVDYEIIERKSVQNEVSLSVKERLILSNQYDILSKLTKDEHEKEWYQRQYDVIKNGYETLYEDLLDTIYNPMSKKECTFVIDIIEVYACITNALQCYTDKKLIEKFHLRKVSNKYIYPFPGFDHNDSVEMRYSSFAKFFMFRLDRFCEIHDQKSDYNSHAKMSNKYNRMIVEWKKSEDRFKLKLEDVKRIINS